MKRAQDTGRQQAHDRRCARAAGHGVAGRRLLLAAAGCVAAAIGLVLLVRWWVGSPGLDVFLHREPLEAFLRQQGARAPLAFMLLQALQVVLAPIPGHLLGVVSGLAFGLWRGTLYTVLGVGFGSALVLGLARWLGRPAVERLAPDGALRRVDQWAARRGPLFFFLFFLFPFLPDDLACLAVGVSPLPLIPMFLLILAARLPGHFAAAWIGATATRLPVLGWILIGLLAGLLLLAYWRYRRVVERWLLRHAEGIDSRRRDRPRDHHRLR